MAPAAEAAIRPDSAALDDPVPQEQDRPALECASSTHASAH